MNWMMKNDPYSRSRGSYILKYRIIPYILLIAGFSLTTFLWFMSEPHETDGIWSYSLLFIGFFSTIFVVDLILLYIKSFDWALTVTESTTRQLKDYTLELTKKIKIIEQKNRSLEQAKKKMTGLMKDLKLEKDKISKEKVKTDALLGSIGDGMIAFDKKGRIELMNKAAESMFGYKIQDLAGKVFSQAVTIQDEKEQDIPREDCPVIQALTSGQEHSSSLLHPLYFFRQDKTKFPAAIVVTPVVVKGKIEGAIMVLRDITREWDIDRSKTEFVSLASHQLRTPLSTIGWYAEMLLAGDAGKLNQEQEEYVDEIYTGNRRMVELVNSLLNVSRIELGTLAIESEMTSFTAVCESVLKELVPSIQAKQIKLNKKYDEHLCMIASDPKLIRIIFQNLLTNAIKYTPAKGQINVDILQQGQDALIKVADTGYGIPEHQKSKIFTKLFRADNAREKVADGTGLGLYIIKLVVDSAGGKIWFESKENQGTIFYVTIPLSGMKKKDGSKGLIEEPAAAGLDVTH